MTCESRLARLAGERFVEEERAGDGGVEAFDRAGGWDGDAGVGEARAVLAERPAPSLPIRRAAGLGEVGLRSTGRWLCRRPRRRRRGGWMPRDLRESEVVGGGRRRRAGGRRSRRRRADGFLVPRADGAGGGEDAGGAEGFGGADEGAEVAGVLEGRRR